MSGLSLAGAALAMGAITYLGFRRTTPPPNLYIAPEPRPVISSGPPPASGTVVVHVVGAVLRPGVYEFPASARVKDAVAKAGPFSNADLAGWNLAAHLQDGTQINIAKRGATPKAATGRRPTSARPRPTALKGDFDDVPPLPVPVPDAYRPTDAATGPDSSAPKPSSGSRAAKKIGPSQPIHLNAATSADFQQIPGIGPATAQRIIEYRRDHGEFQSVDELMEVKGIGPKKLEQIRPFVTL